MGMDQDPHSHRSTYAAVPQPPGSASSVAKDIAPGHLRGRSLRIAGFLALASLVAVAGSIAWLGGTPRRRTVSSLRNRVELREHEECKPYEVNIDYRGLDDLRQLPRVRDSRKCSELCSEDRDCAAWTWGKLRNVEGFSDVCFLKSLAQGQKAQKYCRYGAVAGIRSATPCSGSMEELPSVVHGHVRSRDGFCLEAVAPVAAGSTVAMGTCEDGKPGQEWTYVEKSGQVKSKTGLCLDAVDKTRPFVRLQMYPCDTGNWSQQWMFDNETGLIKSWRGSCVDAAERKIDGGMVFMQTCDVESQNQKWLLGVSGDQPPQRHYPVGTLYCFALMLPDSYEQELLAMQHQKGVSLFACDEYAVYSNRVIQVDEGVETGVVNSDLKCGKGGEFGTALNLDIFIAVWTKVVSDARFEQHDWTVKVDPDCVFFPRILKQILQIHPESQNGVFLNNCKFGMHGPLEVFSRNAVTAWAMGSPRCVQHFQKKCGGDCFWGEDLFVDQCLWKVLGVRRENDFRLLLEDHCEPPKNWDTCSDGNRVAFHPFKTVEGYQQCLENAGRPPSQRRPPAELPPPTPEPIAAEPSASSPRESVKPSNSDELDEVAESGSEPTSMDCHTAVSDERCYIAVKWAMDYGIKLHPDWYEGLDLSSTWYDFQEALHGRPHVDCPMPCKDQKE